MFQLVLCVFNRKGVRKLMKLVLGKSSEDVASHANLVFSLFQAKTHRLFITSETRKYNAAIVIVLTIIRMMIIMSRFEMR